LIASSSETPSRQRTNSLRAKRSWVTNGWIMIVARICVTERDDG
jgi:uncharacterized membrane protein